MRIIPDVLTILMVIFLPLPYFLLYETGGIYGRTGALIIFTLLGLTDYLDGLMARRYGETSHGKLLDPIADKIFIAVIMVCIVDFKILPFWLVAPVLLREALVSEIRGYGIPLEVTELAKIKTTIQMFACGLLFILDTFGRHTLIAFISGALIATLLLTVAIYIKEGSLSSRLKWAISLLSLALAFSAFSHQYYINIAYGIVVAIITVISGGIYFKKGIPLVIRMDKLFALRMLSISVFIVALLWVVTKIGANGLWMIILILSLEYAVQAIKGIKIDSSLITISNIKDLLFSPIISLFLICSMSYPSNNPLISSHFNSLNYDPLYLVSIALKITLLLYIVIFLFMIYKRYSQYRKIR